MNDVFRNIFVLVIVFQDGASIGVDDDHKEFAYLGLRIGGGV